ncbi:translation initiation factor IF-2-like [Eptesicus fuscus]|uniref:translation initiation factor IF-2-like n=1 Tax=Eptesicus fuscus TaxID=29078 RepID=UPI00240435AF|nr:translation initiation factor IF-2-like [Eptesicus fuscus]
MSEKRLRPKPGKTANEVQGGRGRARSPLQGSRLQGSRLQGSRLQGSAPPTARACGCGRRGAQRGPSGARAPRLQPLQRQLSADPQQTFPPALSRAQREVASASRGRESSGTAEKRRDGRRGGEGCPAPRTARALPTRGVCSPRTAGRGSWLLGARPGPPCQARGSGRPERRRPWSRHGARSSANGHGAACRARGRGGAAGLAACPGVPAWAAEPRAGPARTSEAVCQAEIHPRQVGGKFPRPALGGELLQLLPRPNYAIRTRRDFHRLQGAPGTAQGKWPRTTATDFPPSLTRKRKAPLGVPETLDYPHRADRRTPQPHTRGRGRAGRHSNQRAGGRALLLRRPHRGSGPQRNSSSRRPPPLSSPFSSRTDG